MMNNIFICGCGHTGTTLLLAMLLEHSKCFGIRYESRIFFNATETAAVDFINSFKNDQYEYFIEKTPTNVYKIDTLLSHWPNSKIIVCIRNPLDVIASLIRRGFSLEHSINRYINDNKAWFKFKDKVIIFKYEDFIQNPQEYLGLLCSNLNIEFESKMFSYFKNSELYFNMKTEDFSEYINQHSLNNLDSLLRTEGIKHRLFRNYQLKQPLTDLRNSWRKTLSSSNLVEIFYRLSEIKELLGYINYFNLSEDTSLTNVQI